MRMHRIGGRRAASMAAVVAMAGSAAVFATGSASADTHYNVDQWTTRACSYVLCLWYLGEGQGAGGAGFGTNGSIPNLDGYTFFIPGSPGNDGMGHPVRNDAGEISDPSIECWDYAFYSVNYGGPADYVEPGWGGNLGAGLANNEASVEVACA